MAGECVTFSPTHRENRLRQILVHFVYLETSLLAIITLHPLYPMASARNHA